MCGLSGLIDFSASHAVLKGRVEKMNAALLHRGPDGANVSTFGKGIALGHVRLAIIDLSTNATQPMLSVTGRSAIAFNGEIYNFRELRAELESLGARFRTLSDTEVLLNAYEVWGAEFVERLNGMFAFALYDATDGSILLARDRLGIKPLYLHRMESCLRFASEIKGITADLGQTPAIDAEGLAEYLAFQNNYGERTLVNGVTLFPPGCLARIAPGSVEVHPRKFWQANILVNEASDQERRSELDALVQKAVAAQVYADVPVNSFLSGGIDSCAIAASAAKHRGRIMTFTCGFDLSSVTEAEQAFDERLRAELLSYHVGSEHYEHVLKEDDFLAQMDDWAWHAEEPRVGSNFPNYSISRLASKFTKVCLSGTGGDELFGGYPWRYAAAAPGLSRDQFHHQYFGFWNRMLSPADYTALSAPMSRQCQYDPFESFREKLIGCEARVLKSSNMRGDAILLFEMETFLHGLLLAEDKASMAHALEVRVPLLDNTIIDFSLSTPYAEKVVVSSEQVSTSVYGRGSAAMPAFKNGKRILRDVLSGYVPPEISSARKQGFSPPFETWFRRGMAPWITDQVFGLNSPLGDLLDMKVARRLWEEHLNGSANHRLFIWGMIALHQFCASFLRRCV